MNITGNDYCDLSSEDTEATTATLHEASDNLDAECAAQDARSAAVLAEIERIQAAQAAARGKRKSWATPDNVTQADINGGPLPRDSEPKRPAKGSPFFAHLGEDKLVNIDTNETRSVTSANSTFFAPIGSGEGDRPMAAFNWFSLNQFVTHEGWLPGREKIIRGYHFAPAGGELVESPDSVMLNTYNAPRIDPRGDASKASLWVEHVRRIYPDECEELLDCFAHMLQKPGEKLNRGILLLGEQGVGKDAILKPLIAAVGSDNCSPINPQDLTKGFNAFAQCVLLIISEAAEADDAKVTGASKRTFYERSKVYMASPPETVLMDRKYRTPIAVQNVCRTIITSNHPLGAIFIDPGDRRHFVCLSPVKAKEVPESYFLALFEFYRAGGAAHVSAWLRARDISRFNPFAWPRKTDAWHDLVGAMSNSDNDAYFDAIEVLGKPDAVTLAAVQIAMCANLEAKTAFERNSPRGRAHRMNECGYTKVDGPASNGRWRLRPDCPSETVFVSTRIVGMDNRRAAVEALIAKHEAERAAAEARAKKIADDFSAKQRRGANR